MSKFKVGDYVRHGMSPNSSIRLIVGVVNGGYVIECANHGYKSKFTWADDELMPVTLLELIIEGIIE